MTNPQRATNSVRILTSNSPPIMKRPLEALPNVKSPSGKIKTIHRTVLPNDFTSLPNRLLKDKRISFRARGVLAMMLAMPEDWQTYAEWIEEQGTEGREALQSAFKELEEFGYLSRQRILHPETKKFTCYQWVWFNEPYNGYPSAGLPANGKPADTKYPVYQVRIDQESKEAKETPPHSSEDAVVSFPSVWKPKPGTKEQKRLMIPTPTQFPSEAEFDKHLYDAGLDAILTYRPDLHIELCDNKWHFWKERNKKWFPIVNWKKFVSGLNDKIATAYTK